MGTNDGFNEHDAKEAKKAGIPFYVIKRHGVWKFTPGKEGIPAVEEQLAGDKWYEELPGDPCSRVNVYGPPK